MSALILLAHGSRNPSATEEVASLAQELGHASLSGRVKHAFLEMVDPTLEQAIAEFVSEDIYTVTVLPLFLNSGNHVMRDIPETASRLRRQIPKLELRILPHIGSHSGFSTLVASAARGNFR